MEVIWLVRDVGAQWQIEDACALLSDTEVAIIDIGFCCDFSDQAHFQRNFKRATNMTPARYHQL
jgi:AraC-like DNA-binding protein